MEDDSGVGFWHGGCTLSRPVGAFQSCGSELATLVPRFAPGWLVSGLGPASPQKWPNPRPRGSRVSKHVLAGRVRTMTRSPAWLTEPWLQRCRKRAPGPAADDDDIQEHPEAVADDADFRLG